MSNFLLKNLQAVRKSKYKTQDECAEKLEYKRSTYASYESGNTKADVDFLIKFSTHFGISVDDLLFNNHHPDTFKDSKRRQSEGLKDDHTARIRELERTVANLNDLLDQRKKEIEGLKSIRDPVKAGAAN